MKRSFNYILQVLGFLLPAIIIDDMALNQTFRFRRIMVTRRASIHKCRFHCCLVIVAGSMINVQHCKFTLGSGNWLIRKILEIKGMPDVAALQSG